LELLLPSVKAEFELCRGDHEMIVVDNGSNDGTVEWLRSEHPWVKVIALPENRYFVRGNAAGVAAATRDVLVFLNNDMRVEAGFLVELLKPFGDGDVFAVSSRIEMQGHRAETGLARCFVRRGELRLLQAPGVAGDARAPMWAGGGSSAFDRRKYDAIGGFEDLYEPCYVEDVSLSWQAWRRGWRCLYAHDSVVHHAHRGTSSRVFSRARLERLNWRNTELFFVRGVTDPLLVLTHGIWFGWNLRKRARMLSLSVADGVLASLAVLPRLPMALVARQSSRRFYRRSVQSVLRVVTEPQNAPN
jgi:GT2 family glycosyltransferase